MSEDTIELSPFGTKVSRGYARELRNHHEMNDNNAFGNSASGGAGTSSNNTSGKQRMEV
jgi:choline transport protein